MADPQWVWVIGAGLMQMPLLRAAKERGYRVLATDRNPEAPGRALCDDYVVLDVYDWSGHLNLARRLVIEQRSIVACIATAIDAGHISAAVADYLGLPSLTYRVARRLGNKIELREALGAEHPMYMADEARLSTAELWVRWFKWTNRQGIPALPCVIKPADNCATRGVSLVHDLEEFADAVPLARQANHDDTRILIEEYLRAEEECASDWFVTPQRQVIQVNGARRHFSPEHFGVEVMYTNPWSAPPEVQHLATQVVVRTGVRCGPLKIDFIRDTRWGWVVVEAAGRWSGGFDHGFAQVLSCGRDLTGLQLDWALGHQVDERLLPIPAAHRWACGYSPLYPPGRVARWTLPEVDPAQALLINRGLTVIPPPTDCGARPLFVIAAGDTEAAAIAAARALAAQIKVSYD